MGLLETLAVAFGIYRLLPSSVRTAVETTAEAWIEQALQAAGAQIAGGIRGSTELRRVRRTLARAVALTLAKHPRLDAVAIAADFRKPPFSDEVLRILQNPDSSIDAARVERALAESPFDLECIGLDGVSLLEEIRDEFKRLLRRDPATRELWTAMVIERVATDVAVVREAVEEERERKRIASPLVSTADFFQPWLEHGRLFTHAWQLVGREDLLDRLVAFAAGDLEQTVAILPGRGGIGKTRLLRSLAEEIERRAADVAVRFVDERGQVRAEDLADLPPGPLLLIVDDAHRRMDLEVILYAAKRRHEPTHVLLATRPYGTDPVRAAASRVGYSVRDTLRLSELGELDRDETVQLARQALGPSHEHLADSLASVTEDSPLVTVIGGRLLAQEALAPGLLAQHDEFRHAVLDRMTDEYVHALKDRLEPASARRILTLVAGVGPVRPDDDAFVERASEFLGEQPHEIRWALGEFERAGILIRRGATLRISPDVLADHLYYQAAISGGTVTGYVDRLYDVFASWAPEQVLANLAELDWQARSRRGDEVDLFGRVWEAVVDEFRQSSHYGRMQILRALLPVAAFQPRRVLAVVELAITQPAAPETAERHALYTWSHSDVLRAVPPLLRRVAYHPDYRRRALDVLWELGRADNRELNAHPDHAIRILRELAGYETGRLELAASVLDAVERWLERDDAWHRAYSVLDVVDPLLEKAGSRMTSRGFQLVFQPYFVDPETTNEVRARALDIVQRCAESADLGVRLRAIKSLGTALRDPQGHFGSVPSEDLRKRWVPEQLRVMRLLHDLAEGAADPLVTIAVLEAVSWHACHSRQEELKQAARAIVDGVEWTFEALLTKHLTGGHFRLDMLMDCEETDDASTEVSDTARERWKRRTSRLDDERVRIADELLERYPGPEDGAALIEERLKRAVDAGQDTAAGELLWRVANRHPQYGVALARFCLTTPKSHLSKWLPSLITGFRSDEPGVARDFTAQIASAGDPTLRAAAADVCRQAMWDDPPDDHYVEVLESLLSDSEPRVVRVALHALGILAGRDSSRALQLALEVDPGEHSDIADELFGALSHLPEGGLSSLDKDTATVLLTKLDSVQDLGRHWTEQFLSHAFKTVPRAVVDLVLRRVRRQSVSADIDFRVLPYDFESAFTEVGDIVADTELLREIRDLWIEAAGDVRFWLPKLFAGISQSYNESAREVLSEWIDAGNAEQIEAVVGLVSAASWRFVFVHSDFVLALLRRAADLGPDSLESAKSTLLAVAATRGGSGVPGQPFPHDVEARDRAKSIAERLPMGSVERAFYEAVAKEAAAAVRRKLERDEELGT